MSNSVRKIVWIVFLAGLWFSCSDDDSVAPLFDIPVDQRVEGTLDAYQSVLVNSEFGWKLEYQPNDRIGMYNIYLKFDADQSVRVTTDANRGIDDLETTYRIGISHFPELVFENYTVFHNLFEVDGFSLEGEFEFLFDTIAEDRVTLTSKTDIGEEPTTIVLEKATATDEAAVVSLRDFYDSLELGYESASILRNLVILDNLGGLVFKATFAYNNNLRQAIVTILDETTGSINSQIYPIVVTPANGFVFLEPLVYNGTEITTFDFDADQNQYVSTDGGLNTIIGYDLALPTETLISELFSTDADAFGTLFSRYLYFDDTQGLFLERTSADFVALGKKNGFNLLDIVFDDSRFGDNLTSVEFVLNSGASIFAVFEVNRIPGERLVFSFVGATDTIDAIGDTIALLGNPSGWYVQRTNESPFPTNPSFSVISAALPNYRFSVYGL